MGSNIQCVKWSFWKIRFKIKYLIKNMSYFLLIINISLNVCLSDLYCWGEHNRIYKILYKYSPEIFKIYKYAKIKRWIFNPLENYFLIIIFLCKNN